MTYSKTVRMKNTGADGKAGDDLNRICNRVAPAVDTTCVGATTKEISYTISGTKVDVDKVYAAGQRDGLW